MQIWNFFLFFALAAILFWALGAFFSWKGKKALAVGATVAGLVVFLSYIIVLWIALDRPPMRTMGETRLWYSLFLPLMGLIVYSRWNYKWLLSFSTVLAAVFITINLFKPEIHSKTMMPALQSPWFAPHVIIYMMAYALLGAAFVMAVYLLFFHHHEAPSDKEWTVTDNLVYVGWAFLTLGMLSGALWAKMAWGIYPLSVAATERHALCPVGAHRQLRAVANVLVGHQLSAVSARHQCAYLLYELTVRFLS